MAGLDPATQPARVGAPRRLVEAAHVLKNCPMPGGFVYIMASGGNGTLYVGVTAHPLVRVRAHRGSYGSNFTKRYNVNLLVWFEEHESIEAAIQRETSLKRWQRKWKLDLIEKTNPEWKDLFDELPRPVRKKKKTL